MIRKCERCHDVANAPSIHYRKQDRDIPLCVNCYHFMGQRFDEDIEEYILRKE